MRSASVGFSIPRVTEIPFAPGGASEPINTSSPIIRRACMILLRHSGGVCPPIGEPPNVIIATISPPRHRSLSLIILERRLTLAVEAELRVQFHALLL